MSSIELKVKSKHLSEEARIIRREERKQLGAARWLLNKHRAAGHNDFEDNQHYRQYENLRWHRTWKVRDEARATHIAHALLKGIPYEKIEQPLPDNPPKWDRVKTMLFRYGHDRGREIFASIHPE